MLANVTFAQQTVTKITHKKAIKTDVVTTGTMTIQKPEYICISTDDDKDRLVMDGTRFSITMGNKMHTTDSRQNAQFQTLHKVLKAVINGQPMPPCDDLTVSDQDGLRTITIEPKKKKRQLFTSFVLVVDGKTMAFQSLRMNGHNDSYTEYQFK